MAILMEVIKSIKDTYNKAIEVCQYSPYSYSSATNPTVCGIEQIIGRTVADGVREKYISIQPQDEDEQIILNQILETKFKKLCTSLDSLSIKDTLPIIKKCNL